MDILFLLDEVDEIISWVSAFLLSVLKYDGQIRVLQIKLMFKITEEIFFFRNLLMMFQAYLVEENTNRMVS